MGSNQYTIIAILVLLILLAAVAWKTKDKKKRPTDFRALFIMGLIWFVFGVPFKESSLWIVGLILMVVGLVHKDKWKTNTRTWNKCSKQEQKRQFILFTVLTILLALGVVVYFVVGGSL